MIRLTVPAALLALAAGGLQPCDLPDDPTPTPEPVQCVVTGCSGQICASEPMSSTCEWTCVYGCYQYADCEAQASGECGWTTNDKFDACVADCESWPYEM